MLRKIVGLQLAGNKENNKMQYYNSNLKEKESFTDASGPWLIDNQGNRFFDCWLGSGSLILGHEKIKHQNVCKMLPEASISNLDDISLINNLVDFEIGSFGIQTSGSSAITRACRIARAVTNRRLIALIGDFWHGSEDEFLFRHNYELLSDGLAISPGNNYVWFTTLESFLSQHNCQEFAAILVEPIQGANPKANVIKELTKSDIREKIRNHNILLIFDEIITGFRNNYGSTEISRKCDPDIVVFGKAIGGGYPIGVVIVNSRYTNIAKNKKIFWGGTFSANPTQIELMINQLMKLQRLDYRLINNNLDSVCKYILEKINMDELGYQIIIGNGFARLVKPNKNFIPSRGFLVKKTESEIKLDKMCKKNKIYVSKNRLIFPSVFNIYNNIQ